VGTEFCSGESSFKAREGAVLPRFSPRRLFWRSPGGHEGNAGRPVTNHQRAQAARGEALGKVKVLAIIGRGRSGSTILDNTLGEIDNFFSVGELHNLWKRGLARGHACGCGKPTASCPFWSEVLHLAQERLGRPLPKPQEVVDWQARFVRPSSTRKLLQESSEGVGRPLRDYVELLDSIYSAIGDVSDSQVIVDSSKRPAHGALLHLLTEVSPYFIQLVRDPRAVAYSRTRKKSDHIGEREMRRDGSLRSALRWRERNREAELVRRHHPSEASRLIRYEDFVSHPEAVVEDIVNLVGERLTGSIVSEAKEVTLRGNHTAAGNPSRFMKGNIRLRADDEWVTEQKPRHRHVVTGLTLPILRRYGYETRV